MNLREFKRFIMGWLTPNTYSSAIFGTPPQKSGVYLIVRPSHKNDNCKILYIGSSSNLHRRFKGHPLIKPLKEKYGYIQFFFKEEKDFLAEEKKLIRSIKPKHNKVWVNS